MTSRLLETVLLQPHTRLIGYTIIPWEMEKVAMGAIGGFLFGEDKEPKKKFRQSPVGQRNREVLVSLSSQVYAYIASIIGSSANLDEFVFRIWVRFEIYRQSGEIVRTPEFSVEIFRFVGQFGGTTAPAKTFTLSIAFVGTLGNPYLTSFFKARIAEIKKDFTFLKFAIYPDYVSAPKNIQALVKEDKSYLVVEDHAFEIVTEFDPSTKNPVSYCQIKKGKTADRFPLTDAENIARFVLQHSNPKPELRRTNVSFQRIDDQLVTIESKVEEAVTKSRAKELDVTSIEETFAVIVGKIEKVEPDRLKGSNAKVFPELKGRLTELYDQFRRLKTEHAAAKDQLQHVETELRKNTTDQEYLVLRSRAVYARYDVEEKIIKVQYDLYQSLLPKLEAFTGKMRVKKR